MGKISNAIMRKLPALSRSELVAIRENIDELLATQTDESAEDAQEGYIEFKFVSKSNGKRYGPYKHRRVWKGAKLTDEYLGKASQDEYTRWLASKGSESDHSSS
jgi:hypothetical protein